MCPVPPSLLSPCALFLPFPIFFSVSEFISEMRCWGGVTFYLFVCVGEGD